MKCSMALAITLVVLLIGAIAPFPARSGTDSVSTQPRRRTFRNAFPGQLLISWALPTRRTLTKSVRAFPKLTFKNPLLLTMAPATNRFFVGEQAGKIYSFPTTRPAPRPIFFLILAAT